MSPRSCAVVRANANMKVYCRSLEAAGWGGGLFCTRPCGSGISQRVAAERGLPHRFHLLIRSIYVFSCCCLRFRVFFLKHPSQVTPEVLVDIAGKIPQEVKDNLWAAIKSGSFQNMAVSRGGNPVTNPRTMSEPQTALMLRL